MRIWCFQIGIVLVLHFNPGRGLCWWTASPRGSIQPSSKVLWYLLKIMNMNNAVKKKANFINSCKNEGLSPSSIALSFDGFSSILWLSVLVFIGYFTVITFFFGFPTFSVEHHWRDLISRNPHLVHPIWYRICFTFQCCFYLYQCRKLLILI
jgi:hypothetical protein